jgi:predicted phosphodiesterase
MTKIWIMSDLHCEFGVAAVAPELDRPTDVDLVILAGDFHHASKAVQHAMDSFPGHHIVMLVGNHEHYKSGMTIDAGIDHMRAEAQVAREKDGTPICVLENDTVELCLRGENIRIIGATLWTDFNIFGDFEKYSAIAASWMNDYSLIRGRDRGSLSPSETAARHAISRVYVRAELQKPFDGTTVVITHHLPSMRSCADRYKTDPLTPAFISDCSDLLELGADLWVHGHTHDSFDYFCGHTRVICNPRGYPNWYSTKLRFENQNFDPVKIVDF